MNERDPRHDVDVDVTETDLILRRPLDEMSRDKREAISGWLVEHDIDPDRVAVDAPVERHEHSASVTWREQGADGLVKRRRFPAVALTDRWPAPFPTV